MSKKKKSAYKLKCEHCHKSFQATRSHARFCSNVCRARHSQGAKSEGKPAAKTQNAKRKKAQENIAFPEPEMPAFKNEELEQRIKELDAKYRLKISELTRQIQELQFGQSEGVKILQMVTDTMQLDFNKRGILGGRSAIPPGWR